MANKKNVILIIIKYKIKQNLQSLSSLFHYVKPLSFSLSFQYNVKIYKTNLKFVHMSIINNIIL